MNDQVKHVVDMLFEEIEENEEVCSIHDEVMNNCQERYENLVASGYSQEEAIGAVVESLKGMDEVLRDYPRKAQWTEADFRKDNAGHAPEKGCEIAWDRVRSLKVNVKGASVSVFETDGRQTLNLIHGAESLLKAQVEGDTLVITQEKRTDPVPEPIAPQGFLGALARLISSAVNLDSGSDCRAEIGVPAGMLKSACVTTLSGDVSFHAQAEEAVLQTTSGDMEVNLGGSVEDGLAGVHCERLKASSISGDLGVQGTFISAAVSSTSGDIDFAGLCGDLRITTVSGDVDAEAMCEHVNGSTVSGDFDLRLSGVRQAEVDLKTVSGDVSLTVPDGREGITVAASTRSGDVSYHNVSLRDGAPITARIQTVSGDVEVQG